MNTLAHRMLVAAMALLAGGILALAPAGASAQPPSQRPYSQAELDQMLAPIALYPDALLSQILMAATYPIEVVEAARWSRANPGLRGDDAVRAVAHHDWDPSVRSLVAFPQLLARMDEDLGWTRHLGDAFLLQEAQMMDTIQELRRRAYAAGTLAPDDRLHVYRDRSTIVIEPADPRVVYLPYYDPWVAYGPWWWSAYPPVAWAPWPGWTVRSAPRSGVNIGLWWGPAIQVSTGFFFGVPDWRERHIRVVPAPNYYYRPPVVATKPPVYWRATPPGHEPLRWRHDPQHRRVETIRSYEQPPRAQPQIRVAPGHEVRPDDRRYERRYERHDGRGGEGRGEPRREPRVAERGLEREPPGGSWP